ncbi:uncharacterized protein N7469_000492 [Penicillium citrinum]|uniref:Adenylyl-sulfate kinase n=1 Tax=Penicillium citrinum TaxID=5077 RepID=A0A9W9PCS0_PENCI|nr:uncharacterized protein N7469_000492 [Penicillium citrinum]KAJ5242165.1 hypothetical protein N7469_000492 [Penicillium citrinum]KAK5807149.1 hypothetical protein VI817_001407 [Penicillium citrinum]
MPAAPLIWINGFPGSGKLTVAKVFKQLTSDDTIILDNHQLIDPVEARFPRLHPEYQKERHLYRQAVFKEHVYNKANLSKIVVFTDFQSNNELGRDTATEYKICAMESGRVFLPVYLICDLNTNLKRVNTIERIDSGTKKLTNVELVKNLRWKCDLFRFDDCPGLTLDSTGASPLEIASKILDFVESSRSTP